MSDQQYDDARAGYYFREADERALLLAFIRWWGERPGSPMPSDVTAFLLERREGRQ